MLNLKSDLSQNELSAFRIVYKSGPISRVGIARKLNLTRAAISIITKKLIDVGLVLEVGKGMSTERRGRREVLLTINPDASFIIAVHIALSYYDIGLVDLTGKVIENENHSFPMNSTPHEVLEPLTTHLIQLIERHHLKKEKIFCIVVAIPGIINYKDGYVRELTLNGWQGYELKKYLENRFDIKVLIENDVKTYTLGEFQFGAGKHVNDMICLWLGNGIGAGIVTNGQLMRGISSSAGEIGFNEFILEATLNKSILTQNNPKCWGDTLSLTNIKNSIKRGIAEGWRTNLKEDAQISDFVQAIETGDPLGSYIFKLLSRILGTIGQNLIYTFNPEILLLSGPIVYQLPRLATEVRKHLDEGIMRSPLESVEIKTSMLGPNGILIGGVALMLEYLFINFTNNH